MPKYVPWDQQPRGSSGTGNTQFLKLEPNKKYKVRLVSKPLVFFQHWDPIAVRSPQPGDDGKIIDPLMLMGFEPKRRYSIWVIDREDGKLKIMDFPPTLYEKFVDWKTECNDDPGGPNGPDWVIRLEVPGNDKRRTKYNATALDRKPFTKEENEAIANGNLNEKLADLRRDHSPDEIRQKLSDAGKMDAKPQPKQALGSATNASAGTKAPAGQAKKASSAQVDSHSAEESDGSDAEEGEGDGLNF